MNNSKEQNIASGNPAEIVLDVYDSDNNLYTTLPGGTNGFKTGDTVYRYKDNAGKDVFTKDILDLPMYASLDEKTGDIIITAPGSIYNTDEFQKTFDKSILESYSLAYKLNPNYKVSVMEKNEETGVEEEKQVTIPEWIEKLNESFKIYKDNLRLVRDTKKNLVSQYGEKANNLSTSQINRILQNPTSGVYIPDILFSVNFFGDNPDLGNPFESIRGKSGADGSFTLDDLKSVFTRENFGRSELAGVLATIDGALKSSNWDKEDTYTDADGNTVKNRNSADEASKLIAFKDFLLKNHPESEWYQQVGDNIETLCLNFDYFTTRVFANIANVIEAGVTEGNGHAVHNWIKEDLDPTMEQYNMYSQLETDAAQAMQVIGMIGGTLLGSAGAGIIAKGLGALVLSPFAVGASLAVKAMPALQKLTALTTIAKTFSTAHPMLSASASFLLDTLHDAILFDSTTLRDTLEAADGDTRAYWEGQLADNMKWWTGMAGARTLVKFAGKTPVGKALDAWLTPYINKKLAVWGERKADFYDRMAGGSLIRKIEEQIRDAKYGSNKFNRLVKKHIQLEWNEILRTARKELGDIKIETKLGIFPTKEGYKDLLKAKNNIKAIENAIDSYARNINYKVSEYISPQYDPATKQMRYINPDLAKANQNASDFYYKLVSLTKKYGLSVSDQGFLNQDMINYWVGSAHLETMIQMSKYGSAENAKLALENIPIIKKNIAAAKSALPQEITALIDQGIQNRVYQNWYKAQNEFAKHKGLVNAEKIDSYDNNPIWKEIGYMPANIKTEPTGRFLRNDGTVEAVISQDIEHFTYRVSKGQNYADPELVRFNKLRALAKADVNRDIIKAYNSLSSTKNVIKLSGEDTEYARKINENKKSLEKLLNVSASEQFKPGEIEFKLFKSADGEQTVNVEIDLGTRSVVISSLSPDEVSQFLANKKVIKGKNGKISDNVNAENYNDWFNNQSSEVKKYLRQKYIEITGEDIAIKPIDASSDGLESFDAATNSYELFKRAVDEGGAEFEAGLQRAYLLGDEKFSDSPLMNEAARNVENGKEAFYDGVVLTRIKGELRSLMDGFDVDTFSDDLVKSIRSHIEDYVNKITSNEGARAVIDSLAGDTNGADLFARYFSLKSLHEKANLGRAKKAMADAVWEDLKAHDITIKNGEKVRDLVGKVVNDVVEKELDDAASALRTVNPDLADAKDLFANVEKINNKIMGAEKKIKSGENGYVMYLDDNGREVYAQVDPAFASLYTYRYQIENAEASALAKMNAMMSRMFRYGTTSVNLSSFGNQLFRDFGNALLVGGSWSTIRKNADNLVDVFGERIVNEIKQFDPSGYEMRQVEQLAKDSGQTINEAAVSRELMRGSALAPSTTETTLYAKFMKEAYGKKSDTDLNNLKSSVESLLEKYNPDKLLNGKRENYLRRRVYASSYNDALKQGYNIEQARTYAEFAMNNATTNFSRQLYHLQAIADSTPYFRAAINGSKSFWRMWSLDPVGITGRITGGLIIPVMALTAFSLENKEDAEIYKNIPEYQKDSSIVFVFDGKPISIPVPQEISNIINPFRHFVEYLNIAQPNAFHELAMNDLLGFAPYDLTGFSTVDMDHMASDPTFFDRVSRGFARVFSSMAPVPLKTVYMLATGTDPYTGKSLRDPKNNVYFNEETGTTEVMDYNQNAFARLLAEWFGDSGMSSSLAEKVVSGVVGTTGSNLLGDITALFREGSDAFMKSAATNIGEQMMKPFDVPVYNLADATWKREIKNLTFEKEALLSSKKMVALNNELKFATDPEKRKKILAERSNLVNEFTQKVGNLVKGLSEEYGGTFDRQKFAAVMNLLNFDSNAGYQSGTQASSDIALSGYWDGRDAAIHTMQQLGINGTNDASIFGYLVKDDTTGKTVMKYTSPIAIMDMKQQWYNQDEINYANINALIKSNGIKDAHDSITKQINAIYGSKSRLSNADHANIEAIQINWNTQLAKVLAPYISQMTPEAAINNSKVLNLLYPYVEVPGSWEKNNSNRSPSLGNRGNKKKAYYDSWIKSMFSVNDRYKGQY